MEQFLSTEILIIELLFIVAIVAIAVRRLRIPYTVALVIVGLLITFQSSLKFELTPELILALFVPPLVFEAAFHLNIQELRRNLPAILLLAVPGVILTTFIIGGMLVFGIKLSLPIALRLWCFDCRHRPGCCGGIIPHIGCTQTPVGAHRR